MRKSLFGTLVLALSTALGLSFTATAQTIELEALAAFDGAGHAYQIADDRGLFMGEMVGTMFVESPESGLNAAGLVCPATIEISLADGALAGGGHCIMTTPAGDSVFARWSCSGQAGVGCGGNFTIIGGNGRFQGVRGQSQMMIRTAVREAVLDAINGRTQEAMLGMIVWNGLTLRLPE